MTKIKPMKKTKAVSDIRCHCCGSYEPECDNCKHTFDEEEEFYCGKELFYESNDKHYCKKCHKKLEKK